MLCMIFATKIYWRYTLLYVAFKNEESQFEIEVAWLILVNDLHYQMHPNLTWNKDILCIGGIFGNKFFQKLVF